MFTSALLYTPDTDPTLSTGEGRLLSLAVHAYAAASVATPALAHTPEEQDRMDLLAMRHLRSKFSALYPNASHCPEDANTIAQLFCLHCPASAQSEAQEPSGMAQLLRLPLGQTELPAAAAAPLAVPVQSQELPEWHPLQAERTLPPSLRLGDDLPQSRGTDPLSTHGESIAKKAVDALAGKGQLA